MELWNIIRDWFVQYAFGGFDSFGASHPGLVCFSWNGEEMIDFYNIDLVVYSGTTVYGDNVSVSLGDWLSTTATLIVMISICVCLFFLVRYFFRMFAGLLSGR